MSTAFLSKLIRLNATITHQFLNLKTLNENPTRIFAVAQPMPLLMNKKPTNVSRSNDKNSHGCGLPSRRYFSSSSSSSSDSDGGEKGSSKEKPIPTISVNTDEAIQETRPSRAGVPPPACASLPQDLMTRPLDEHEVGLDLTRRGRSKPPPMTDNTTGHQPQKKKDQKSRKPKKPEQDPPATSPSKTSPNTKTRVKDRLEALTERDRDRRVYFAYKLLLLIDDNPDILENILWTDECNFNLPKLSNFITKPPIAESESLPQITWCGVSTKGTVGPYFFNSHVTDRSYLRMLENYLIPELEKKGYNLNTMWFQQDGAPWHRSKPVLDFLTSVFKDRLISLGTDFMWPPKSQDLTPMDYFFWDYMKLKLDFKHSKYDLCFQKSFREILTREVNSSGLNVLQGAIYQIPERLEMCLNMNGGRFVHLLYPDRYEEDGTRKVRKPDEILAALNKSSNKKVPINEKITKNENVGVPIPKPSPLPPIPTNEN